MRRLLVCDLGVVPYAEALELQRAVARARISRAFSDDLLLLVEHPPVITTGRSSKREHLLASAERLASRGVELHDVERGGDVTFHGPGQLVGYPVIDLKQHKQDLHWYLRQVEEALIRALAVFHLHGERSAGFTGVWTGGRKIASIGVHARDWVVWHGFALNISTDLSWFDLIVPCGIDQVQMTSIADELRRADTADKSMELLDARVRSAVVAAFESVFGLEAFPIDTAAIQSVLAQMA